MQPIPRTGHITHTTKIWSRAQVMTQARQNTAHVITHIKSNSMETDQAGTDHTAISTGIIDDIAEDSMMYDNTTEDWITIEDININTEINTLQMAI